MGPIFAIKPELWICRAGEACGWLTWEPSGLLLPAAPGVITFITAPVLLAMLSGASFTGARAEVRLCRSTKGTRQMSTGAMGEHLQGA